MENSVPTLGLAHLHFKLKTMVFPGDKIAMLHACARADGYIARMALAHQVRGDAARAIAGDFRFTAVGIDQASLHIGIGGGKEPLHAIRAHAVVAVADAPAELCQISGRMLTVNDQKIISAAGRFGKRDPHLVDVQPRRGFQISQVV